MLRFTATPLLVSLVSMNALIACSPSDEPGGASGGAGAALTGGTLNASGGVASSGGASSGGAPSGGAPSGGTASGGETSMAGSGAGGVGACVDTPVPGDSYTCAEQAGWGKCGESWMEGYCDLSCGRCGEAPGAECGVVGVPPDLTQEAGTAPPLDCSGAPVDACPFESGLQATCKQRFALGINYAWRDFGTDFGGLSAWSLGGVSGKVESYNRDLANMKANGAGVIRWWMFPDMRGDGIVIEAGSPTGITDQTKTDIQLALELAQRNDVYLVLTLFSFDAFRPTRTEGTDVEIPGISALVTSEAGRTALVENVVGPVATAVAESPYASRLLGWDVINEPEWAIMATGAAPSGNDFSPNAELDAVPLADMKAFINLTLEKLGQTTPHALRSVGWAAAKWSWAFEDVTAVEFNQPHIYAWVNDFWPYSTAPGALGYPDRPVVMGEYYLMDGPFDAATPSFATVMNSWYDAGYAGAWSWHYFDACIAQPGSEGLDLTLIGTFAQSKDCSVSF